MRMGSGALIRDRAKAVAGSKGTASQLHCMLSSDCCMPVGERAVRSRALGRRSRLGAAVGVGTARAISHRERPRRPSHLHSLGSSGPGEDPRGSPRSQAADLREVVKARCPPNVTAG